MEIGNVKTIFILGNPRSGTSLFRLMLNSHKNIVATPESGFAHWLYEKYKNWCVEDNPDRIEEYIKDVQKSKKFETWYLENSHIRNVIIKYNPKNYAELVKCIYLSYTPNPDEILAIADKNNYYINHISELPNIWPDAKYIHIIRDGRDVACSYKDIQNITTDTKYIPKLKSNIYEIAEEWKNNNISIAEINLTNPDNYYLLKFEDLIADTRKTLYKLMQFLKIPFDSSMLTYYSNNSKYSKEPKETLSWKMKTLEKPDSNKIGRYKTALSPDDIRIFNKICRVDLSIYDYEIEQI